MLVNSALISFPRKLQRQLEQPAQFLRSVKHRIFREPRNESSSFIKGSFIQNDFPAEKFNWRHVSVRLASSRPSVSALIPHSRLARVHLRIIRRLVASRASQDASALCFTSSHVVSAPRRGVQSARTHATTKFCLDIPQKGDEDTYSHAVSVIHTCEISGHRPEAEVRHEREVVRGEPPIRTAVESLQFVRGW